MKGTMLRLFVVTFLMACRYGVIGNPGMVQAEPTGGIIRAAPKPLPRAIHMLPLSWPRQYHLALQRHPLWTKSLTAAVFMCASDALAQRLEAALLVGTMQFVLGNVSVDEYERVHNWRRTGQVAITGITWTAPAAHYWHNLLDRFVTTNNRLVDLLIRLALDATVFTPISCKQFLLPVILPA
jgi:hypothetical protein